MVSGVRRRAGVQINYQARLAQAAASRIIPAHLVDSRRVRRPDERVSELAAAPNVHIPTVAGAAVVAYNIPGIAPAHLDGRCDADIFFSAKPRPE